MDSLPEDGGAGPLAVLARFRQRFHACLTARADELAELADAVLCAGGPVRTLAELSLAPEHRRGHGALYDAVNHGRISIARLRRSLAGLPLPRAADGRLMLAVDVSSWLRPGAATSPGRLFCHVYGRAKGQAQMIPGWPYSVIAALEPGRSRVRQQRTHVPYGMCTPRLALSWNASRHRHHASSTRALVRSYGGRRSWTWGDGGR
jgi:DDE superfamily endonuclease